MAQVGWWGISLQGGKYWYISSFGTTADWPANCVQE